MNDLLQKFKRTKIPNTYYALIALAFFSVIGVMYLANIAVQSKRVDAGKQETTDVAKLVRASRNMEQIRLDMTKPEVLGLLGNPDWAVTPEDETPLAPPQNSDIAVEWHWNNPACRDATVIFSPSGRVMGWDTGADFCNMANKADYADFACSRPERAALCR